MKEFLIQRIDGNWFEIPGDNYQKILGPSSFPFKAVGSRDVHCIEIAGCLVTFSIEEPGIHIVFESDIDEGKAHQIVSEICANIESSTGQRGKVVQISS